MHIAAEWLLCRDGVTRPMIQARVHGSEVAPILEFFLVDPGADRTVLTASLLAKLRLQGLKSPDSGVAGLGGRVESLLVTTVIELQTIERGTARMRGVFAALSDVSALDVSVLGRDVLNHFDIIMSRRNNEIAMLAGNHRYQIVTVRTG